VVKEHVGADPFSGAVFVFRAKRADRIVWKKADFAGRRSRTGHAPDALAIIGAD
jgi:hypothetical protein